MNKETNKYNHKYNLMALSDVETYREWETDETDGKQQLPQLL